MDCALPHAEQASLDHLEVVGLEGGEEEEPPLFWGRQRAGLVDRKLAGGPGCPIAVPLGQAPTTGLGEFTGDLNDMEGDLRGKKPGNVPVGVHR
jgi:hypothetical protein